jgi:hypothetical protein
VGFIRSDGMRVLLVLIASQQSPVPGGKLQAALEQGVGALGGSVEVGQSQLDEGEMSTQSSRSGFVAL